MRKESENHGGCGCLGILLGLGALSLMTGSGTSHDGRCEDLPPWDVLPPPEFLEDSDGFAEDSDEFLDDEAYLG